MSSASSDIVVGDLPAAMDWTTVELATALICACFPTYGPLLRTGLIKSTFKSWYTSLLSNIKSRSRSTEMQDYPSKTDTVSSGITKHSQYDQIYDGRQDEDLAKILNKPLPRIEGQEWRDWVETPNRIQVKHTIEVV